MSMALLVFLPLVVALITTLVMVIVVVRRLRRNATEAGYVSVFEHLRAVPRNDEEKRQAVDLALKGAVLCVLGLFFPPMILIGLFPFYYGARKLIMVWLGLDLLLDDGDRGNA